MQRSYNMTLYIIRTVSEPASLVAPALHTCVMLQQHQNFLVLYNILRDTYTGQYTIEITIADSTEINDTIVEMITVLDNDKSINTTAVKIIMESDKCTSSPTNGPVSASMYVDMYVRT